MAKEKTGNGKRLNLAIAGLAITLLVIGSSGLTNYVNTQHETSDATKAIGVLKTDGCDPAKKSVTDVAVIKTEVAAIKEDVREMRAEQRAGKKEILEAIEKNNP